jgi:hypothetical protein
MSAFLQFTALRRGLWKYGLFSAIKQA